MGGAHTTSYITVKIDRSNCYNLNNCRYKYSKAPTVTVAVWIALTTAPTDQKVQYSDRNLNSYLTIYT
jgi:hypothetical protein